jgi:hypothetical protein
MSSVSDNIVSEFRTICEVHREIYDILLTIDVDEKVANTLIEKLEEAYKMAKKMNNKLRQYKHNYDDEWWEKNRNIKE